MPSAPDRADERVGDRGERGGDQRRVDRDLAPILGGKCPRYSSRAAPITGIRKSRNTTSQRSRLRADQRWRSRTNSPVAARAISAISAAKKRPERQARSRRSPLEDRRGRDQVQQDDGRLADEHLRAAGRRHGAHDDGHRRGHEWHGGSGSGTSSEQGRRSCRFHLAGSVPHPPSPGRRTCMTGRTNPPSDARMRLPVRPNDYSINRRRSASATAAVRSDAPSFSKMCSRCVFTVSGEM